MQVTDSCLWLLMETQACEQQQCGGEMKVRGGGAVNAEHSSMSSVRLVGTNVRGARKYGG